ncbi:MAG: toll/interleukin-1 receptor domain-containing protein [Bacteroidetes bacterium]|nr:toll/interleukin-1 receptor domain-containing protein [Bacteroidota bacterium]
MNNRKNPQIFICHSSIDKPFVRKLAQSLKTYNIEVWFDEWEIKVGESLREKIETGITKSSYLCVVLSKNSVKSKWVTRELNAAFAKEMETNKVFILPLLIDKCKLPLFLKDKKYANFLESYETGLNDLLESVGIIDKKEEDYISNYFVRFTKIKPFWWGIWKQPNESRFISAGLFISKIYNDGFDFEIKVGRGAHTGGISGRAKIIDSYHAIYKETMDNNLVEIKFEKKGFSVPTIIIEENFGAHYYHGQRAYFLGPYIFNGDILIERQILSDESVSKLYELMGEYYWQFRNNFYDIYNSDNLDDFKCKVFSGGVPGLYTSYESIIMLGNKGEIFAAYLEDKGLRYFTSESEYKKKFPKTIEAWRDRFKERKVIFSKPKKRKEDLYF